MKTGVGAIALVGLSAFIVTTAFSPLAARADDTGAAAGSESATGHRFYGGVLLGPSFANDGLGTELAYGVRGGMKLSDSFSLGVYATYENLFSLSIPSANLSVSETILALEPEYYPLGGNLFYLGLKLGIGITSASASTGGTATVSADSINVTGSETDFAAGPAIGINYPVGSGISVGAELNTIFVQTPENSIDLVNLLATATYWF